VLPAPNTNLTSRAYLLAATSIPPRPSRAAHRHQRFGNTIVLSWPASAVGYVAETTATLGGAWSPVAEPIVPQGDRQTVTIPASGAASFYRLKK